MPSTRRRPINEINMVPFIDVMLVLLIIFMVTATVITPGMVEIPSAGQSTRPPDRHVVVLVDLEGRVSLAGELVASDIGEDEAVARVQSLLADEPQMAVMLAADSELQYQQVMSIMGRLRDSGVQRLGLSVK